MNSLRLTYLLAVFPLILSGQFVFAMDDDQPGPHGGVLQPVGPFHAELRALSNRRLVIYLLDEAHRNPTTEESSVGVRLQAKDRESGVECAPKDNHFDCETAEGIVMRDGDELILQVTRKGIYAGSLSYTYPFRSEVSYPVEKK